jgi:hypothetical protein
VHSIEEWAAMAQANRGFQWQPGAPMPGYPAAPAPQPGYGSAPPPGPGAQSGFPDPSQYQQSGFPDASQYQQSGFPDASQYQQSGFPDASQYQQSGFPDASQYQQPPQPPASPTEPRPTQQNQPPPRSTSWDIGSDASTLQDAVADVVLGAMTKGIGRVIGRKMRQAYNERVAPAMAARQDSVLRDRMAIAQRHPDLRACLNDQVIFLAGGTRTLPLASAMQVRTVDQADALVAQLRG